MDPADAISRRKGEQLRWAAEDRAGHPRGAGWDDVHLVHQAIPRASLDQVDTTVTFLGHELQAPFVIAAMTGGHPEATALNRRLGEAAERLGIGVGVGSQRAALRDPALEPTYAAVREGAPSAFVMGNLGACQLVAQDDVPPLGPEELRRAVDMIGADALAVHLNVLEELVQTEGDRITTGFEEALREVAASSPVPVVAKETGSGVSREAAGVLAAAGTAAIDVGGAGGTSFARIEAIRAEQRGDERGSRLGATFAGWGIPTAASVLEARGAGVPLVATGGVRTGLDAARAIALGATVVGVARPFLEAARRGLDPLLRSIELFVEELKVAVVLTGAASSEELRKQDVVLTGFTLEWARARGIEP